MTETYPQISTPAQDTDARALKILNQRLWHFTSVGMGKEAPQTKEIRGEPGGDNLGVLGRTGDINRTPYARALDKLGFTRHQYDAGNKVMISTKP